MSLNWLCGLPEPDAKKVEKIPSEVAFLNFADYILNLKGDGIILDNRDFNGIEVDIWTLTVNCASLNKFIDSIIKLGELRDNGVLDEDMFKACAETAARKAINGYNEEDHFCMIDEEGEFLIK